MNELYGAIEAGGTKFVCAVGTGPSDLRAEKRFPTDKPAETLGKSLEFFRRAEADHGPLAALGIASFGPVDLDPASKSWGFITSTPKKVWRQTDFARRFERELRMEGRVAFDTDVNGAALGEHLWGAAQGLDTFLYVTVGTGIGGGGMAHGELLHGLIHPEMGHLLLPRDPRDPKDKFEGLCPAHHDCLEGLAAGPAIEDRWKCRAHELAPDHEAWELEAEYLAMAVVNWSLVLSPRRIILGGGVMEQRQLFPLIRARVLQLLNGYLNSPAIVDGIDSYLVPPDLGNRAGILGALALAQRLAASR